MYPANQLIEIQGKEGHTTFITRDTPVKLGDIIIDNQDMIVQIDNEDDLKAVQTVKYLVLLPAIQPIKQIK